MFNFDANFFRKNQDTLLFVANNRWLRFLLGINKLPKEIKNKKIDRITPNSVHHIVKTKLSKKGKFKRDKITAEFYTRPMFAEALAFNLSPFCYFQSFNSPKMVWRFSPVGIFGCLLIAIFPWVIGGFCFFGTTTSYGVSGTDGNVGNGNGSWSTCRSAGTGDSTRAASADFYTQEGYVTTTSSYYIKRAYITFATDIPAGSTVSAGSVNVYVTSKDDGMNDSYSYVAVVDATNSGGCTTADYSKSGNTKGSGNYDVTDISTSANLSMSLNATGLGFITLGGTTDLAIKGGHDIENQDPGASWRWNQITIRSSRYGSNAPYLSVTYTTPSGPTNLKSWNGLAKSSIKSINGLALSSVKKINGLS